MLFGRWPWEVERLPRRRVLELDRFYAQYIETMYGQPKEEDDDDPFHVELDAGDVGSDQV